MNFKQKTRKFRRNVKAVSPVIATIILVAISIVMAIAVAYWALGIGNSFTKFEKVQYTSTYPLANDDGTFTVVMNLKNTGTATATVDNLFLNGRPFDSYSPAPAVNSTIATTGVTIPPGASTTLTITSAYSTTWTSGMTIQVDVMTAAGNSYPTTVILP